jgi:hypothetical protein
LSQPYRTHPVRVGVLQRQGPGGPPTCSARSPPASS